MKKIDILNLSKYLKFPGDNKLARIGHVNSVITDVNTKIDAPANPVTGDALVYNGTDWVAGYPTDPTLQTAAVEVSSAEILDLHNNNKFLLPALPEGKAYKVLECIASYIFGTTPYNSAGADTLVIDSDKPSFEWSTEGFIRGTLQNRQQGFFSVQAILSYPDLSNTTPVTLSLDGGTPMTGGDGILKIKLVYQVIDVSY